MAFLSEVQGPLCPSVKPYHVFISHRGTDTKKTLASIIYHRFTGSGVNVFFDLEEFKSGQKIPSTIREAICSSSVQIAILSPNFAGSVWCLEELHWMQRTDAKIIPVFDGVPPGDLLRLRNGEGEYADAFKKHESKYDGDIRRYTDSKIKEWKEALHGVSDISGLELDSQQFNGDQGKLVNEIYMQVMEHLRKVMRKSIDGLYGVEKAVDEFDLFLKVNGEQSEKVKIVGIVGTPGSGMTTLAEEFYYKHRTSYDRSSLLVGVRNASKQNGMATLQTQLLRDLTTECLSISNVSEGKDILADRVRRLCHTKSLKFLIVIDDVTCQDQLEVLLRDEDVLGSGSLVIVTSRNKAVLKLSGISLFYETKPLRPQDARKLLCRSAFRQSQSVHGLDGLIETALHKCGCFPKFLKSLGGNLHLYGNSEKQDWEDELQMMIPDIYNANCSDLDEEERQIFLDIACFFEEIDKNSAIRVWAGSGWRGARALKKLEYKCLVHVDDATNCLSIPKYLRDLGREIADRQLHKAPDLPCRLWRPNTARNFLKGSLLQSCAKIRGTRETSLKKLSERATEDSFKIDLLHVSGDISYCNFSDGLRNLVWLRWKNCPETPIFPPEMNNLRVLELIEGNLKTLNLNFKLAVELREIGVMECTGLKLISPSIGLLNRLEKITLHGTISLESLPLEFCKLQALKHLVLKQCECLKTLPVDFGHLTNLQYIDFSYCRQLSSLPRSFRKLTQLKILDLRDCRKLIIEEDIFEQIRSIEELTMENCKELKMLPTQTTLQGSLRKLNLLGTSLKELPDDINKLTNLQQLKIGSPFLKSLPSSLMNASLRTEIEFVDCRMLTSYPSSYKPLVLLD